MRLHLRDADDSTFGILSIDHTEAYEQPLLRTLTKHLVGLWLEGDKEDGPMDVRIDSIAVFDRDLDFVGVYDENGLRQ